MQWISITSFHVLYVFSSIQISDSQYQNRKIKLRYITFCLLRMYQKQTKIVLTHLQAELNMMK